MAVPVPATTEIFAASSVKFKQIDVDTELVTPTGAAIISEIAEEYILMPKMTINKVGFGAGYKDIESIPNVLKVVLGEEKEEVNQIPQEQDFVVLETNIDDSSR